MSISVLVLHERWPGATGLSAYHALLRAGVSVHSITEADVIPLQWRSIGTRVAGRLLRPLAVREFNERLLALASQLRPDLFLAFKGQFVLAKSLRTLRASGIRCVNVYPDVSFTVHGPYLEASLPEYDWIFTTKTFGIGDMRTRLGIQRASVLAHAFDREIHRPRLPTAAEAERLDSEVSFIGTWSPAKEVLLEALLRAVPEIRMRVFGSQWERVAGGSRLLGKFAGYPVVGTEYAIAIGCSRVNLGLLSERRTGASDGDQITSRTFHIPAAGGCLLHQRTWELGEVLREGQDCEAFEGPDELAEKVVALLADDGRRQSLARSGLQRVRSGHSWDHRIRQLVRRLQLEGAVGKDAMAAWPTLEETGADGSAGTGFGEGLSGNLSNAGQANSERS